MIRKALFSILLLASTLFAYDAPYRVEKFQAILQDSKLQAPVSSYDARWSVKYGKFKYFSNQYFYLQDNNYMTFQMCELKHRSELREKEDWQVTTKKKKILEAEFFLFPLNSQKEFTFLQIHADANYNREDLNQTLINKPLLRITWWKKLHKKKNHLWAVIRMTPNIEEQKYVKLDLGEKADDFSKIKITVQDSELKIFLNEKLKIDMDVHYWDQQWNYFKAGVYMQDSGCAKVLFKTLQMK
jgi:hypothetical protein